MATANYEQGILADTDTTMYTTPANQTAKIEALMITNTDIASRTFTLNIVESGNSPATTTKFIIDKAIATNETLTIPEFIGHNLKAGDFLTGVCDVASVLNFRISTKEIT